MDKLDSRAIASHDRDRPRMTRYFGTPCKTSPHSNVSPWMMSTHPTGDEELAPDARDIFDD